MNMLLLFLMLGLSSLGNVWSQPASGSHASSPHPALGKVPTAYADAITPSEWQELRTARDTALKKNPDLVEAGKQLDQKLRDFQRKLDLAVLKIDPTVAPIVAQLESIPGPAQPSTTPPSPPAPPVPAPNVPAPRSPGHQPGG
jgi:hypothetical protein